MKAKTKIIIGISIFVLSMIGLIFVIYKMIDENNQCISNPMVYVGKQTFAHEQQQNSDIIPLCSCEGLDWKVYFDKNGLYEFPSERREQWAKE